MSSRMQITLEPELRHRAAKKAEREGISFAEYVRRAIAKDLGKEPAKANISEIFDLGRSTQASNIAKNKNQMIAEAIEHRIRRK